MINVVAPASFNRKYNSDNAFNENESLQEYTFKKIAELRESKDSISDASPVEDVSKHTQNLIILENFDWVSSFETSRILMDSAEPAGFKIYAAMEAYKKFHTPDYKKDFQLQDNLSYSSFAI